MKLIIFLDSDSELQSFHTKINVNFPEAKFTGNIYVGKVVQYSEKKLIQSGDLGSCPLPGYKPLTWQLFICGKIALRMK